MNKDTIAAILTSIVVAIFILIIFECFVSETVLNICLGIMIVASIILVFCFIMYVVYQIVSFIYWAIRTLL